MRIGNATIGVVTSSFLVACRQSFFHCYLGCVSSLIYGELSDYSCNVKESVGYLYDKKRNFFYHHFNSLDNILVCLV